MGMSSGVCRKNQWQSLEMAKYTMAAASSATPVDLNMAFSPSASSSSPGSSSSAAAAAAAAAVLTSAQPGATLTSPHYAALPMSSLLGMKTLPVLAMHPSAASALTQGLTPALTQAYTAKMPTAGVKKSDRQKFAPY
ncbi:hypothetical protein WMY93_018107 [Mugilogobius chulae]|uniref:Uncharacterized protein n=1 Tax=Mugilogobius chulae TaxID=88201 RepID=A0AAW0NJ31_9GOBI